MGKTIDTSASVWRWVRTHPKGSIAATSLVAILLGPIDLFLGWYERADVVLTKLYGPLWLADFVNSVGFKIACVVLFAWLLIRAAKKHDKLLAAMSDAGKCQEAHNSIEEARQALAHQEANSGKLPYLMTKAMILGRDIDTFQGFIARYSEGLEKKRAELEPYFGDEIVGYPRLGNIDWDGFGILNSLPNLTSFEIPRVDKEFERDKPTRSNDPNASPGLPSRFGYGCFDPAVNKPFVAAQKRNLEKVQANLASFIALKNQQVRDLAKLRSLIEQEIGKRGYDK